MSFPSTNLAILGRDVPKMLSRFDFLSKLPSDDFEINTYGIVNWSDELSIELSNMIKEFNEGV